MVILELLNGVSMDLVTSLCDNSRKQDVKQKNMKYKRLQFSLPSITCRPIWLDIGQVVADKYKKNKIENQRKGKKGTYGIAENNANTQMQVTLL